MRQWHKLRHGDNKNVNVKMASLNLNEPLSEEASKILFEEFGVEK